MKTVFPKEILEYTSQFHRNKHLKKSQMIYLMLLLSLIGLAVALPFIKIDLYRSSPGMIRPSKEKNLITSPINGKVDDILIIENSSVKKGDTLIKFDNSLVLEELNLLKQEHKSLSLYIEDLLLMCHSKNFPSDSLKSPLYKSEFFRYKQELSALQEKCERKMIQFNRQNHLFKKGVIAKIKIETASFDLNKAQNDILYFKKHQKSLWLDQLHKKTVKLRLLTSKLLSLQKKIDLHVVLSPSTGNIQELKGLERNNYLYTGSAIAEISPQTDLMVECYVSPTDIGLLKNNHPVKFQIDAFNHHSWGTASGQIIRINQDVSIINNLPMYKVLCSINEKRLFLNKSINGSLQKGMTLTAMFFIDTRSLFELLFDELEDWLESSSEANV